ncbi:MAG: GWxTD domain-containing protein [Acidobacteriota bacterium]
MTRARDLPDHAEAQWREGPVRYIITIDEEREFKQLEDDEARARFIEAFWARRDPEPRTLINEYRHEFWNRVAVSNQLFTDSTKPGWKTDMGRYYILLGPPDDRDTSLERGAGVGRRLLRGAIVWHYRHAPSARIGTDLTLVFTQDASGEYRASSDPRVVETVLGNSLRFPGADASTFGLSLPQLPPRFTRLQLLLDLGRLEEVPSVDDFLTTLVTAKEFTNAIPFAARYDHFAGWGGKTIVVTTLSVHPDPMDPRTHLRSPDYLLVGRLDREDGTGPSDDAPIYLHEADFQASTRNADPDFHGPFIYQTVRSLKPGRYAASFAAFDRSTQRLGSYTDHIDVPSFSRETLSLSSLCLSDSIEPVSGEEPPGQPYIIGHLRVIPRLIPTYRNGDTFAVYYQIYGTSPDPETGSPDLDIQYQFLVRQGAGYIRIGKPIRFESVRFPAQGWSFPLRDWPTADFKIQVTVTDSRSGQMASGEVEFQVL